MSKFFVRRALIRDAPRLNLLLHEWLGWDPGHGRILSIQRAIRNREFIVAEARSQIIGFVHFILHEDVIDGAPNAFITAFYVQEGLRGVGVGTRLLREATVQSAAHGATFIETSTIHCEAKAFYETHGFRQTIGDIGEVFLELDVGELFEGLRTPAPSPGTPPLYYPRMSIPLPSSSGHGTPPLLPRRRQSLLLASSE